MSYQFSKISFITQAIFSSETGTADVQGQIYGDNFALTGGYCVNYPSNIFTTYKMTDKRFPSSVIMAKSFFYLELDFKRALLSS